MSEHALRAFRRRQHLSAESVAAAIGVSTASISRIENRKQKPSLDLIEKLIAFSGGALSADAFVTTVDCVTRLTDIV